MRQDSDASRAHARVVAVADLRAAREAAGLSRDALAEMVGVRGMTLARWEWGTHWPSARHRQALADAIGVALSD